MTWEMRQPQPQSLFNILSCQSVKTREGTSGGYAAVDCLTWRKPTPFKLDIDAVLSRLPINHLEEENSAMELGR